MHKYLVPVLIVLFTLAACNDEGPVYSPKPRMYPRVEFPERVYEWVENPECGFKFKKLVSSKIELKDRFFDERIKDRCWFNLEYPHLGATIHYTYYDIDPDKTFTSLVEESFQLAYEHSKVATAIQEFPIIEDGVPVGMGFDLKGPVASPYQFYLSDTSSHFIRGALYFNSRPNPDSLKPMLTFVKADLDTFVRTFEWY